MFIKIIWENLNISILKLILHLTNLRITHIPMQLLTVIHSIQGFSILPTVINIIIIIIISHFTNSSSKIKKFFMRIWYRHKCNIQIKFSLLTIIIKMATLYAIRTRIYQIKENKWDWTVKVMNLWNIFLKKPIFLIIILISLIIIVLNHSEIILLNILKICSILVQITISFSISIKILMIQIVAIVILKIIVLTY